MNLEPGTLVLVAVGGNIHCTARVTEPPGPTGIAWLDVNSLGAHLPQMYNVDEITEIDRPSALVPHGLCISCLGWGIVDRVVPTPEAGPCGVCNGTGRLLDQVTLDAAHLVDCDLCRTALTTTARP